ncbi:hypothetical protein [Hydrogenophaga sp. 5NK40-0174]|uniref:hypothetical protein n=1 Tax=Hydrogenophaga sp. 5NK40-0174 TaxID=3127649 RepID=UPI00334204C0
MIVTPKKMDGSSPLVTHNNSTKKRNHNLKSSMRNINACGAPPSISPSCFMVAIFTLFSCFDSLCSALLCFEHPTSAATASLAQQDKNRTNSRQPSVLSKRNKRKTKEQPQLKGEIEKLDTCVARLAVLTWLITHPNGTHSVN